MRSFMKVLHRSPVDRLALHDTEYNHAEWFFGLGSRSRWLGYTLGYGIVRCWLRSAGNIDAAPWITVAAQTIIVSVLDEDLVSSAASRTVAARSEISIPVPENVDQCREGSAPGRPRSILVSFTE